MITRRQWLFQMLAAGAAGCVRRDDRSASENTTAIIAYQEDVFNSDYDEPDKRLVFLPLVAENQNGELEGRLAESWEHSPDYREWTYHLRPGLRWHDGVAVTAHDLKFSLDLLTHPEVLQFASDAFESIRVLEEHTVRIRTGRIHDDYKTWPICYPQHRLERFDPKTIDQWEFWKRPIGNGPYRFARYVPGVMIEYEVNPDYYGRKPRIEHVRLKFAKDSLITELLSGNVDSIGLTPAQVATLAADNRFRTYYGLVGTNILTIWWQHNHAFFRDPRVRRALTLAINRSELRQVLQLPDTIPLVDGPFSRRQLRLGTLPAPSTHDPVQARTLLDMAGWRESGGGALRQRDGKPFRFNVIVRENVRGNREAAVYIQDQFRRIGVGMEIQFVDQNNIYSQMRSGTFEAAMVPYQQGWTLFGEQSWIGYSNQAAARQVDRLETTADPDVRDAIYRDLTAICRADAPVTFLCPWVGATAVHRRLHGLSSPGRVDPLQHMEELWIEE